MIISARNEIKLTTIPCSRIEGTTVQSCCLLLVVSTRAPLSIHRAAKPADVRKIRLLAISSSVNNERFRASFRELAEMAAPLPVAAVLSSTTSFVWSSREASACVGACQYSAHGRRCQHGGGGDAVACVDTCRTSAYGRRR
jgi:hypothetical protein